MRTVSASGWVRWGVIVSSIAQPLSMLRGLRRKSGLCLAALYGPELCPTESSQPLALRITNVGRESVVVSGIAVRRRGGSVECFLASRNLPRRLEPNESTDEPLDPATGLPTDAEELYACDSSGHEWPLCQCGLKELLEHQAQAACRSENVVLP